MDLTALIRRCIGVKIVCTRRFNFDFVQEFPIREPFVKDDFCCRTATNVAHADKKNSVVNIDHFFNWLKSVFNKYYVGLLSMPLIGLPCAAIAVARV
jgi:hypothetical protein